MLTLPFLFKNSLVEIVKYRWEKAAVIHKDLAQELEDCIYRYLAGRKGILLSPERKALNPNSGEEGEEILRLLKQLALSADCLSHIYFH